MEILTKKDSPETYCVRGGKCLSEKNRNLKHNQKFKMAHNKAWMGTKYEWFAALIFTNLDFLTQREERKSFPIQTLTIYDEITFFQALSLNWSVPEHLQTVMPAGCHCPHTSLCQRSCWNDHSALKACGVSCWGLYRHLLELHPKQMEYFIASDKHGQLRDKCFSWAVWDNRT